MFLKDGNLVKLNQFQQVQLWALYLFLLIFEVEQQVVVFCRFLRLFLPSFVILTFSLSE